MKKSFSIISMAVVMLMAVNAGAQVKIKSYIGLYGGISTSLNDFGQSNYDNNKAGFGKRGAMFGLDGAVYVYKNLAIGGTVSFQDQGELNSTDAHTLAVGYTSSFKSNGTTISAVNRYHSYNLLFGPQYSFAIHKFIIDLRASAGLIKSTSTPEISIYLADVPKQTDGIIQQSSKASAFAYGANLNLRYALGASWFVAVKGAYINSKGIDITTTGRSVDVGRLVTKQPITELQGTLGIVHSF